MKNVKKIFALTLAMLIAVLMLAACGDNKGSSGQGEGTRAVTGEEIYDILKGSGDKIDVDSLKGTFSIDFNVNGETGGDQTDANVKLSGDLEVGGVKADDPKGVMNLNAELSGIEGIEEIVGDGAVTAKLVLVDDAVYIDLLLGEQSLKLVMNSDLVDTLKSQLSVSGDSDGGSDDSTNKANFADIVEEGKLTESSSGKTVEFDVDVNKAIEKAGASTEAEMNYSGAFKCAGDMNAEGTLKTFRLDTDGFKFSNDQMSADGDISFDITLNESVNTNVSAPENTGEYMDLQTFITLMLGNQ